MAFGGDRGLRGVCLGGGFAALELCFCQYLYLFKELNEDLTRVKREVFPEPLGPMRSMEGRVVRPLARKTKECRKSGMLRTRRTATMSATGDGLIKACAQSVTVDITPLFPIFSTVAVAKAAND